MRLWSIHPKYLDTKGLVALWRESLLAQKVLEGNTKGYKKHPQLIRFKNNKKPLTIVRKYLFTIYQEAEKRNYNFNYKKIKKADYIIKIKIKKIPVSSGQVIYEFKHLKNKLKKRSPTVYNKINKINDIPEVNDIFKVIPGDIAEWEKNN
ncbi:MAG: pyrimidine dimer DNA glycosylase/endonuclease V [bacterium]